MMKKIARKAALIIVSATILTSLSGCGNSGAQSSGTQSTTQKAETNAEEVTAETPAGESNAATEPGAAADTATAETTETAAETEPTDVTAEFEPNPEYDKYALVPYVVEDIDAHFVATISAKEDGSEYELHCNLDGEEQLIVLDGKLNIVSDKTGNMAYDAPIVVQKAIDANNWTEIEK